MITYKCAVLVALALLLRMVTANDQPRFEVAGSILKTRGAGRDCSTFCFPLGSLLLILPWSDLQR
jgi:hypothetical protein